MASKAESAGQSGHKEIEIKLELDPEALPRLKDASLLRKIEGKTDGIPTAYAEAFSTVYYDTPDLDLRKAGLSFRVRREGSRFVQTLKAATSEAGGLLDRSEWETEIATDQPDLQAVAGTPLEKLLSKHGAERELRPAFTLQIERTTYPLHTDAWEIEVTADKGVVEAEGRSADLCEVELELKRGRSSDLFDAARILCEELPARLGVMTKADRGYKLLGNKSAKAVKAKGSPVAPGMSVAQAFQAIGRACLHHLMSNERQIAATRDPEVLHQVRVAIRRLRAAISLFKHFLADDPRNRISADLRWVSVELGKARDLDVFLDRYVEPLLAKHAEDASLSALRDSVAARRERAYEAALDAVEAQRFHLLVLDVAAWIETGAWLADASSSGANEPVEAFAREELTRRRRKIRKRGKRLLDLDDEARHRVRIEVKKLRYTTEFFAPLFEGRKAEKRKEPFLTALENIQEHLGELNDLAVAERIHAEAGGVHASSAQAGEHRFADHKASRATAALHAAAKALQDFKDAKAPWK